MTLELVPYTPKAIEGTEQISFDERGRTSSAYMTVVPKFPSPEELRESRHGRGQAKMEAENTKLPEIFILPEHRHSFLWMKMER